MPSINWTRSLEIFWAIFELSSPQTILHDIVQLLRHTRAPYLSGRGRKGVVFCYGGIVHLLDVGVKVLASALHSRAHALNSTLFRGCH